MENPSNKIVHEYWRSLLSANDQNTLEAWNSIFEVDSNDKFILNFEIDNRWVEKVQEMTVKSPFLIQNFVSVITANAIARYTEATEIQLVTPALKEGERKGTEKTLIGYYIEANHDSSFKEQFVAAKDSLDKALDMPIEVEELTTLDAEFALGIRVAHLQYDWNDTHVPQLVIEWDLNTENLAIIGRKATHDAQILEVFGANVIAALKVCIETPYEPIAHLDLQSEAEKNFLKSSEKTAVAVEKDNWIIPVFKERVKTSPNDIAVVHNDTQLTYQELNEKSNQMAGLLARENNIGKGDLVGVMLERSPEIMVSILAIWKLGAAYIPIETGYPEKRIQEIVENARLDWIITNTKTTTRVEDLGVSCLNIETATLGAYGTEVPEVAVDANDLAYVIYTSGSTGKPKGVMIEHYGMLNHMEGKIKDLKIHAGTRLAQNAPFGFDISVWQLFAALLTGGTTVIYDNDLVYDCDAFVDQLNKDKITLLELVPSYLTEMLTNLENKEVGSYYQDLDRVVLNAEPLLPWMVNKWLDFFPSIPIYNTYGATEVSDDISHFIIEKKAKFRTVPVLKGTINASQINLVNENFKPVPPGAIGEILLSGRSVGKGYLNDEARTKAAFLKGPIENVTDETKVYKTGDLARFVGDGMLEFVGRVDKQVKINGQRVELGAVEHILASLDEVTNAAVLPNLSNSELIAFYTGTELSKEHFQEVLFDRLPYYMVPKVYVHLEKFPLSSNGKIQRSKLPVAEYSISGSRKEYKAPETSVQKELAAMWEEILEVEQIGLLDDFFEIGGHSLKIMNLFGKIRKKFQVELELRDLFNHTDLEGQATLIENAEFGVFETIPRIPESDKYALSSAQERLWILSQVPEINAAYNMPMTVNFEASLNVAHLAASIRNVLEQHEILRTTFVKTEDASVWQKINALETDFNVPVIDCSNLNDEEISDLIRSKSRTTFDLVHGPLYVFELLKRKEGDYIFYTNVHHIISDGWSEVLLIKNITENYERLNSGQEIENEELSIQYKDFAAWQINELKSERSQKHRDYWMDKFQGDIPVVEFPNQKIRPKNGSHNGRVLRTFIPKENAEALQTFCVNNDGSLLVGMMSIWKVLTYIYTKQEDLIIGTPVVRREHEQLANQIGFYVNALAIRSNIDTNETFADFFNQVKHDILEGYSRQSYPFDQIVEKLDLRRDTSRNPLFDMVLVFQNQEDTLSIVESNDRNEAIVDFGERTAKVDLELEIAETSRGLAIHLTYNSDIYYPEFATGMLQHFKYLVANVDAYGSQEIAKIDLVQGEERYQILNSFNNSSQAYPATESIVSLFEQQVEKTRKKEAIVFEDKKWNYGELNALSNQFARFLIQQFQVQPQDLIGVQLDRDHWMMVAYLGVLKARAIQVPVDTSLPLERIRFIQNDSNWKLCITAETLQDFQKEKQQYSDTNLNLDVCPDDVAYVIYTSGSTGQPKGVEVRNQGLVNFISWSINTYNFNEEDNVVKHLNMAFDASVEEVYPTLLSGATLYMAPGDFLLDIEKVNAFVNTNSISIMALPPTLLDQLYTYNNQTLRLVILGGGQLKTYKKQRFEIANHYGPTEATVTCLAHRVKEDVDTIPIGKPIQNVSVYILDQNNRICPIGIPGEIYISGVGLAKGYLNREELTNEKFVYHPHITGERLYKTGDIGRWLPEGIVEFHGRLDDQVKIRGYRIELDEISNVLTEHSLVKRAESIVVESDAGEKEIASYIVASEEVNNGDLRRHLKDFLPDYMMPSFFVRLDKIPLTQNGKVDKDQLPSPYESQENRSTEFVAPRTETEKELAQLWQEILQRDAIGVNDEFFENGGQSLRLTVLLSRIKSKFAVNIDLKTLFATTTIADQALLIEHSNAGQSEQIPVIAEAEMYASSSSQKRLWLLSQISGGNKAYNIPGVRKLKGKLDVNVLSDALDAVVARHEILRTVFTYLNGEVYQIVKTPEEIGFRLNMLDFRSKSEEELDAFSEEANGFAFDIENGPLLRSDLVQVADEEYMLFFNLHHIISDGWSMEIVVREVMAYYNAAINNQVLELPDLRIQYKDYAAWEKAKLEQPELLEERSFWLDTFNEDVPVLNLPSSFPRPRVKTFNGAIHARRLRQENVTRFKTLTSEQGATLFMGLLGVMNVLFYKYSGQTRQVIGTPIAGRGNEDLENQIGFYTNTLALLSDFAAEDNFTQLLDQIKERATGAFANQMYPFDNLVDDLDLERDVSRSPLFDFMIVLQNIEAGDQEVKGMENIQILSSELAEATASKFDMTFNFKESADDLILMVEYNTDIYEGVAIDRLMEHFDVLLGSIVANQEKAIQRLEYLSEAEQKHYVETLNPKSVADKSATLIEIFEGQVSVHGANTALIFEDKKYTYQELNAASNQLARFLQEECDVKPEDRVALCMGRNDRAVIGILSILKTGAAYIPVDLSMPEDRKNFIIQDADCRLVLDEKLYEQYLLRQDEFSNENCETRYIGNSDAYLIYTSGTTGYPKGVPIKNSAIVNTVRWKIDAGAFDQNSVGLHFVSFSFDVSIEDMFAFFLSGGSMVLLEDDKKTQFNHVYKLIMEHHVNTFACPPAVFTQLQSDHPDVLKNIRTMTMGGELINAGWVNDILDEFPNLTIVFEYGLTEAAVTSTALVLKADSRINTNINSIGRSIPNHQVYILDTDLKPVTKGVVGQICISGAGLTEGYWNRPELNQEKFIKHPFIDGEKLFLSGDLGCLLENDEILFLGRMDDQVKIRGNRIELGEIENALRLHEHMEDIYVTTFEENGRKELVTYYTTNNELSMSDLTAFAKTKLPAYMIPPVMIHLDKLPITINGKVDRKKLPNPMSVEEWSRREFVEPENETEEQLVRIWCDVLSVIKVSTDDSFFEIGGNSIKIIQLSKKVNETFDRDDEVIAFFQYPTIKDYANYLNQSEEGNQVSEETLDEAMDSMSDTLTAMNLMSYDEE